MGRVESQLKKGEKSMRSKSRHNELAFLITFAKRGCGGEKKCEKDVWFRKVF